MLKIHRPAGNPIQLHREPFDPARLTRLPLRLYQSGTAALAAALHGCRQLSAQRDQVILPGYACPDLLSAVIHAGARPVLVDLAGDSFRFDPQQLTQCIGPQTLAVISVRFLGLEDDLTTLRNLCRGNGANLIIDSAQYFPCRADDSDWIGDYHILSFGRGKAVNLLHGGAVISRNDRLDKALPSGQPSPLDHQPDGRHYLKGLAYNLAIEPLVYGLVRRLPGLHVGETRYHPLHVIEQMSQYHRQLLNANIDRYRHSPNRSEYYRKALAELTAKGWKDLTREHSGEQLPPLLRYPLLIEDPEVRTRFMDRAGWLGVSRMYQQALPRIRGVNQVLDDSPELPKAERLAAQLVTLPTHEGIDPALAQRIVDLLEECL